MVTSERLAIGITHAHVHVHIVTACTHRKFVTASEIARGKSIDEKMANLIGEN